MAQMLPWNLESYEIINNRAPQLLGMSWLSFSCRDFYRININNSS